MMGNPAWMLAFLFVCHCTQDVPIMPGGYGFSVGDPEATLRIEFFLDFQCPDSKQSFSIWNEVQKELSLYSNKVQLTYQFSPLSWHFYSFLIHQGFECVRKLKGSNAAQSYMNYVFSIQDELTQQEWMNYTVDQFMNQFSANISQKFQIDPSLFKQELEFGSESWNAVRKHWKYTAGMKGVGGAPLFYANGVRIDGAENFHTEDWINFITEYKT